MDSYIALIGQDSRFVQYPDKFIELNFLKELIFGDSIDRAITIHYGYFYRTGIAIVYEDQSVCTGEPNIITPTDHIIYGTVILAKHNKNSSYSHRLSPLPLEQYFRTIREIKKYPASESLVNTGEYLLNSMLIK